MSSENLEKKIKEVGKTAEPPLWFQEERRANLGIEPTKKHGAIQKKVLKGPDISTSLPKEKPSKE